jgi:NADH dehydrogenase
MEKNLISEKNQIEFDVAVIATGAAQNYFCIKGAERSFSVNSLSETERAKRFLKKEEPKKIAIIGSGLTGIETACALKESIDADIHIVEAKDRVLPQFSENISSLINRVLLEKGIDILISARVKEIKEEGVVFFDGSTLDCEMAIWTAGIKPPDFAQSGLPEEGREDNDELSLQAPGNVFAIEIAPD